ncbi:UDP-GlcNAc--UDP-phosphate GlcNAc-1-phosphate transferase [Ancylomarina euxinus]|uniref:UDP-GlcNAc--UDP-phosphate GlcNAc-1-phosphate transferase n=1 Tax=Ancylomarina euxinus TaxID=2283627 RepID=A0A425Y6J3_9BACT|nr:glycosyltransferase family 4 protein [Ancylomarina euxinus]MCZ4694002.1 glycosyltransferase family 4 protein [Ancylomarina euxinus]MUP14578.1 UDP-GlcNAc--UDP-phosphate GlcNAc-1-phosphate transferase [Ancylomarina euxinus]RRG24127.1 UDP-GlcNAc--UDP-phosphate GlcNAc-1-phosphate transferase [Ancylomarina euxinus]
MLLTYSYYFIILLGGIQIYFAIANKFKIVDKPNLRSSHSNTVIRGGGIIFYLAALLWYFQSGFEYPWFYLGLTVICLISFLDDILSLSTWIRLTVHLIGILFICFQLNLFSSSILYLIVAIIVSIGIINAYNFMDGINGITGLYSISVLSCLWFTNNNFISFIQNDFVYIVGMSLLVFLFYNIRVKAKCFAGDVGSVSIAFILLFLLWKLVVISGDLSFFILLVVYGIDSVLTIIHRLVLRENIFEAHRKHLYQILANECRISHVKVACGYALLQMIIFIGYFFLMNQDIVIRYCYLFSIVILLSIAYFYIKRKIYSLHIDGS